MRCEDCLDDLPSRHFVTYVSVDGIDDEDPAFIAEKHLCADCAGWYGDKAVEVDAA